MIIEELYDALINAGADEEKARAASRAVANFDRDLSVLKWMVGAVIGLNIMMIGGTMAVLFRLSGN